MCFRKEKSIGSFIQQSRRPKLSSLQIPARSLESALSAFTRIDIPFVSSPASTRAGLPPRPNSAKVRSSVKSLLPQRSIKVKKLDQDVEQTVLIMPETPASDGPSERDCPPKSFSLNKGFFSSSTKVISSLPVTPVANFGPESVQGRHLESSSDFSVRAFICHIATFFLHEIFHIIFII